MDQANPSVDGGVGKSPVVAPAPIAATTFAPAPVAPAPIAATATVDSPAPMRRIWASPLVALFVAGAMLVLFLIFFEAVSTVLLGMLAATIVASTLHPLLRFIPGPRGAGAAIVGLALIAAVGALMLALSWPLAEPIQQELRQWPQSKVKINAQLGVWSEKLQLDQTVTVDDIFSSIGRFFAGDAAPRFFTRGADVVLSILIWLAFVFIGSIFILSDPRDVLLGPGLHALTPTLRRRTIDLMDDLGPRLRRWVIGTMLSMCIVFTASLIGYTMVGLSIALPLALLAGMCEIVPTVGPAIAAVVACLYAATQSGQAVVGVLGIYAVIQSIEAYIILPMIMRGAVRIHPAVTLFTVVLWGKVFGVPGLMLAIPINLTVGSAVEHLFVRPWVGRGRKAVSGEL